MMKIAGLNEDGSQFKHLAQKLKEANLTVQRIVDLHVGVDMLKILDNYAEGFSGVLKDLSAKNGQATTFNAMFTTAYLNILSSLSNKCYVSIEEGGPFGRIGSIIIIKEQRHNEDETENDEQSEDGQEEESPPESSRKRYQLLLDEKGPQILERLNNLMEAIKRRKTELIRDQENGLMPEEHGKALLQNCEVDDELFNKFLYGTDIEHELLSRGGPNCLHTIYNSLEKRRNKMIEKRPSLVKMKSNGSIKINGSEQDNDLMHIAKNLRPIKTSKNLPKEEITKADKTHKKDNSPNRGINSPTKMRKIDHYISPKLVNSPSKKLTNSPSKVKIKQTDKLPKWDTWPNKGIISSPKTTVINNVKLPKWNTWPETDSNGPRNTVPKWENTPKQGLNSPPKARSINKVDNVPKLDRWPKNVAQSSTKARSINSDNMHKLDNTPKQGINSPPITTAINNVNNVSKLDNSPKQGFNNPIMTRTINSDNVPKLENSPKKGINSAPKSRTINVENVPKLDNSPKQGFNNPLMTRAINVENVPKLVNSPKQGFNNPLMTMAINSDNAPKIGSPPKQGINNALMTRTINSDNAPKIGSLPKQGTNSPPKEHTLKNDNAQKLNSSPDKGKNVQIRMVEENPKIPGNIQNNSNLNNDNNERSLLNELDDLINLIRNARDNFTHAEVELGVASAFKHKTNDIDCWINDAKFKQFLDGQPIAIDLLPRGDANNMQYILDSLLQRREHFKNENLGKGKRYGGDGLLEGQQQQQNEENSEDNAQKHMQNGDNYYRKPYDKYSNSYGKGLARSRIISSTKSMTYSFVPLLTPAERVENCSGTMRREVRLEKVRPRLVQLRPHPHHHPRQQREKNV
ncbi:hypothetical protein niasHT_010867 [Heterodera trifolii]|uniref:Uncharacterized protein n=1 Tax=Heterodera trifolii TaxID=157864 RepID=A0ABD2LD83_9BILA